jgi:RNA polymerase sigma-70 factor (ECF subfamily)
MTMDAAATNAERASLGAAEAGSGASLGAAEAGSGAAPQRPGRSDGMPLRALPAGVLADVIRQAQGGDRGALNELTRLIRPNVERQLARYPVSDEDRLDLIQSTLLQVVRTLGSFRGDSSFTTWLFRVTANEALMLMRSQRRQRARVVEGLDFEELGLLPTVRSATSGDDAATLAEREAHVREALGELPEDYRDVVVAHYHEDLGLHEIARKLSVSESAVRSRLHRARVRLRAILSASPAGREIAADLAAA